MKPTITTIIVSVFTAIFSACFVHCLLTRRDRRKEYNIIAEKIILALTKERQFIINHKTIHGMQQVIDFNRFTSKLSIFKRSRFNVLLKEYNNSKNNSKFTEPNPHGHSYLSDNSKFIILNSIDKLTKSIKFK